jgi:hypothetical protein
MRWMIFINLPKPSSHSRPWVYSTCNKLVPKAENVSGKYSVGHCQQLCRHLWADCLDRVGSFTSHNPIGLQGLLWGQRYRLVVRFIGGCGGNAQVHVIAKRWHILWQTEKGSRRFLSDISGLFPRSYAITSYWKIIFYQLLVLKYRIWGANQKLMTFEHHLQGAHSTVISR